MENEKKLIRDFIATTHYYALVLPQEVRSEVFRFIEQLRRKYL